MPKKKKIKMNHTGFGCKLKWLNFSFICITITHSLSVLLMWSANNIPRFHISNFKWKAPTFYTKNLKQKKKKSNIPYYWYQYYFQFKYSKIQTDPDAATFASHSLSQKLYLIYPNKSRHYISQPKRLSVQIWDIRI